MSKKGLLSRFGMIGCLVAAVVVLAFQLTSWGAPDCFQPNTFNEVACANPGFGVGQCNGIPMSGCATAHIYKINKFPNGTIPAASGSTTQVQADCYQDTPCQWNPNGQNCITGPTLPTGATYYQAWKTVPNPAVPCPPP